ncbi:glycoside hydrolase family 88 protein [Arthrobacter sp. Z1-9]
MANADKLCQLTDFPYATKDGKWQTISPDDTGFMPAHGSWTVGFTPGLLWLTSRLTGESRYADAALDRCRRFIERQNDSTTHDIGFVFIPSFVAGFQITEEPWLREGALQAASTLAKRFNRDGKFLRTWGPLGSPERAGETTIDAMMNLELLYWAGSDPTHAELAGVATQHAETSAQFLVRPDGSTYHAFEFDPETGAPIRGFTHQGLRDASTWTRGQAWAIYGFARAARWSGREDFLTTSGRCADYFLAHLPESGVPPWDFDADDINRRDSSAGAIAAAGLLELASLQTDDQRKEHYRAAAVRLLVALTELCGTAGNPAHDGLLTSGIWHLGAGFAVDEALIYGDYYYMQALTRLQEL